MREPSGAEIAVAGVGLVADSEGALYWPAQRLLVVADLHLEKGSSLAARGVLLPPYDPVATLERIARLMGRYEPRTVVALGDSFHDAAGPARMAASNHAALAALARGRDWIWIAGNHDPDPPGHVGGRFLAVLTIGALTFRHQPTGAQGEIAGHLHPLACVSAGGRTLRRRCFASDQARMVMPALGAYAGGLNVRHRAFSRVFGTLAFTAHMLGAQRLYSFAASSCLRD
jgi:uncharacterized protein